MKRFRVEAVCEDSGSRWRGGSLLVLLVFDENRLTPKQYSDGEGLGQPAQCVLYQLPSDSMADCSHSSSDSLSAGQMLIVFIIGSYVNARMYPVSLLASHLMCLSALMLSPQCLLPSSLYPSLIPQLSDLVSFNVHSAIPSDKILLFHLISSFFHFHFSEQTLTTTTIFKKSRINTIHSGYRKTGSELTYSFI